MVCKVETLLEQKNDGSFKINMMQFQKNFIENYKSSLQNIDILHMIVVKYVRNKF